MSGSRMFFSAAIRFTAGPDADRRESIGAPSVTDAQGVFTPAGQTTEAWMGVPASSARRARVNPTHACFAAT